VIPSVPPTPKSAYLGRAAAGMQQVMNDLEDAIEPGLVEEAFTFMKRIEAAVELEKRTETTPSGARVVRRGQAGGRTPSGGCLR
jgi:citrate lyase beta subunit